MISDLPLASMAFKIAVVEEADLPELATLSNTV